MPCGRFLHIVAISDSGRYGVISCEMNNTFFASIVQVSINLSDKDTKKNIGNDHIDTAD